MRGPHGRARARESRQRPGRRRPPDRVSFDALELAALVGVEHMDRVVLAGHGRVRPRAPQHRDAESLEEGKCGLTAGRHRDAAYRNLIACRPMSKLAKVLGLVPGLLIAVTSGACDEKPAPSSAPSASAAAAPTPTPTPTPAPTPSAQPAPPKPKKKLADCGTGPDVTLDNPALEAEIRKKLDKATGAITKADLKRLKSLNLSQLKDIHELDPCVFTPMTSLKELFLGPGDYDDLSPLAGMTQMESLRASINQVKDLKPLAKLTKLDRLDLGRTQVSDLSPLEKLTSITELQLDDTPVEDLKPLGALVNMTNLSIKHTKVKDGSPLKSMKKLKFLYIGGTPLDDDPVTISPIRGQGTKVIAD